MKVTWVVSAMSAGGISTVCAAVAGATAQQAHHDVSLVVLHHCDSAFTPPSGVELHSLGLPVEPIATCSAFHAWLLKHPQDVLIMNAVSMLEPYWRYAPPDTAIVAVLHDEGNRYLRSVVALHSHIDAVVTVASFMEPRVRRALPPRAVPVTAIHNGGNFPPVESRPTYSGELRLLFIGRPDALLKGMSDIPHILRSLQAHGVSASLTVIGGQDARVARQCAKAAPQISVRWLGTLSHEDCLRNAAAHDVLLMTSRGEAFGMVTVEAMAMGCVPIAYDIPTGAREIIERNLSGFFAPLGDYETVAAHIATLDCERALLSQMANAAMKRARTVFSASRMASYYAELLEDIALRRAKHKPGRLSFEAFTITRRRKSLYHRMPLRWRLAIRQWIGERPKLAYALRRLR